MIPVSSLISLSRKTVGKKRLNLSRALFMDMSNGHSKGRSSARISAVEFLSKYMRAKLTKFRKEIFSIFLHYENKHFLFEDYIWA